MANKKRLIDADACGRYIACRIMFNTASAEQVMDYMADYTEQNAVDAVEVVHGHWIESEGTVCSVCNKHFFTDGPWAVANYKANYCPNCGARMGGEET